MKVKALRWVEDRDKKFEDMHLLRVEMKDLPMNMEFRGRFNVERGEEIEIMPLAIALSMEVLGEDYPAEDTIIPGGVFSINTQTGIGEDATASITGEVTKVEESDEEGRRYFTLSCQDMEFYAIIDERITEAIEVRTGDTVTGVFWMRGEF